jgi:hypothetical protein
VWQLDVALLLVSVRVAASLPRTSRKKRAFPLMSGGAASAGGCLPAVHAPPPLSMRDLTRGEAPRAPSVAFCIVQGSVLPFGEHAPCVCINGRENRGRGRPVSTLSPPHMLPRLGPLFALVRRIAHQTANGSRRHGCEAWKAPRPLCGKKPHEGLP